MKCSTCGRPTDGLVGQHCGRCEKIMGDAMSDLIYEATFLENVL